MIEEERTALDAAKSSPEETRDRILAAARDVIGRKGKRGATTREIADAAGVNEATLFRHFGNKEALIVAVVRHSCPEVPLRSYLSALDGSVEENLVGIAVALTQTLEARIDMIRWSLVESEYEQSLFAREAWRPQEAVHTAVRDVMQEYVDAGHLAGDADEISTIFLGLVFVRVISRQKFPNSRYMNDQDYGLHTLVHTFLNGVRSK